MFRRIRSSVRRCRALLIALVLACVTIQPAMLFACDLHDLAHASSSSPADAPDALDGATRAGTDGEGGSLLHAMFHAVHCCAHVPVLLPPAAFEVASVRVGFAFADPSAASFEARASNLFRPPIAG